jgi:hypothetical protein
MKFAAQALVVQWTHEVPEHLQICWVILITDSEETHEPQETVEFLPDTLGELACPAAGSCRPGGPTSSCR